MDWLLGLPGWLRFFLGAGAAATGAGGCAGTIGCIWASERPKKGAEEAAAIDRSEKKNQLAGSFLPIDCLLLASGECRHRPVQVCQLV
jgi:hypothetical protein